MQSNKQAYTDVFEASEKLIMLHMDDMRLADGGVTLPIGRPVTSVLHRSEIRQPPVDVDEE